MKYNIDFRKLKGVLKTKSCQTNKATDSIVYSHFGFLISNFIQESKILSEEQIIYMTIALQNWLNRRSFINYKGKVNIGDVFFTDLGNCYSPELAYTHPVIILEQIGQLVFVAPVSSSAKLLSQAYHPTDKPRGNKFFRKVKSTDGFAKDCVVILSNIRSISQGRLINKVGRLNNISDSNSLFREIKERAFELSFPKKQIELKKLKDKNEKLKDKNEKLKEIIQQLDEDNQEIGA